MKPAKKGFTLIELLAVIAIIAVLVSLLVVAITEARKRARIAKAQGEVRELVKAWKAYWLTYQEWPGGLGGKIVEMTPDKLRYLQGDNPQKLVFMDLSPHAMDDGLRDPWGNLYKVSFQREIEVSEVEYYQTIIHFPNRLRYAYDD